MKRLIFALFFISNTINGQWSTLGSGLNAQGRFLFFDEDLNNLVVTGNFTIADTFNVNHIAIWNTQNWQGLGSGAPCGAPGYGLTKYNNEYLFSSVFNCTIPNTNWLARWNGSIWDENFESFNGPVICFLQDSNSLYLAGAFNRIGFQSSPLITKFDGVNFLSYPLACSWGSVNSIAFYQGDMYIGGNFYDTVNSAHDLERYNGVTFSTFGLGGLSQGSDYVNSMVEFNNELYIGGSFSTATGTVGNNIMRWDGITMRPLLGGLNSSVSNMHVYSDGLYICGAFTMADTILASGIAKWNGINWERVIPNSANLLISDFLIRGNELYITGSFTEIDNIIVNNIAKYTIPVNVIENNETEKIIIFPNPVSSILFLKNKLGINDFQYSVIDFLGKTVKKETVVHSDKVGIDCSGFSPGLYFLNVRSEKETTVIKFIKN